LTHVPEISNDPLAFYELDADSTLFPGKGGQHIFDYIKRELAKLLDRCPLIVSIVGAFGEMGPHTGNEPGGDGLVTVGKARN
jgi:hypothetical protein